MSHTFVTLQHYLNNHKYGNAEADDLWAALSQVSCLSWHAIFRRVPKMANFGHAKVEPLGKFAKSAIFMVELWKAEKNRKYLSDFSLIARYGRGIYSSLQPYQKSMRKQRVPKIANLQYMDYNNMIII